MNDMDSQQQQHLETGDVAPDFQLYTDEQESWRLSDHKGHPVVLLFFPGAFTSVCTTELNTVSNRLDEFGDAEVVGISTDAPFVLQEFREVENIGFSLLSDHDGRVSSRYGVSYDENFTPMNLDRIAKRAAFVVDREGVIRYEEVLEDAGRQPDYDAIQSTVTTL